MALKAAVPNVFVTDLRAALEYYTGALGFRVLFEWGAPPFYAHVARDEATLALRCLDQPVLDHAAGEDLLSAFIEVTDVDALFATMQSAGAVMHQGLRDEPWGMRSFIARDPNGNLICFAGHS